MLLVEVGHTRTRRRVEALYACMQCMQGTESSKLVLCGTQQNQHNRRCCPWRRGITALLVSSMSLDSDMAVEPSTLPKSPRRSVSSGVAFAAEPPDPESPRKRLSLFRADSEDEQPKWQGSIVLADETLREAMMERASSRHSLRLEEDEDAWMSLREEPGYAIDTPTRGQLLWRGVTAAAISNLRGESVTEDDVAMAARKVDLRLTVRNAAWKALARNHGVALDGEFDKAMKKNTYRATFQQDTKQGVVRRELLRDIIPVCAVHAYVGSDSSTLSSTGGAIGTEDRNRYLGQAEKSDGPACVSALSDERHITSMSAAGAKGHASLQYSDDRSRYLAMPEGSGPAITSALTDYTSLSTEGESGKGQASLAFTEDRERFLGQAFPTSGPAITTALAEYTSLEAQGEAGKGQASLGFTAERFTADKGDGPAYSSALQDYSSLQSKGASFGPQKGVKTATDMKLEAAKERRAAQESASAGRKPPTPAFGSRRGGAKAAPPPRVSEEEAFPEAGERESLRTISRSSSRQSLSSLMPIWKKSAAARPATAGEALAGIAPSRGAPTRQSSIGKAMSRLSYSAQRMSSIARVDKLYARMTQFLHKKGNKKSATKRGTKGKASLSPPRVGPNNKGKALPPAQPARTRLSFGAL